MKKWMAFITLSLAWLLLVACGGAATDDAAQTNGDEATDNPTVLVYRPPT